MMQHNDSLQKRIERWVWTMRGRIIDFSGEATVKWIADEIEQWIVPKARNATLDEIERRLDERRDLWIDDNDERRVKTILADMRKGGPQVEDRDIACSHCEFPEDHGA